MGHKIKLLQWKKNCPNQYRVPTNDPMLKAYAQIYLGGGTRPTLIMWRCRETKKACVYRNREKDCPHYSLKDDERKS